MKRKAKPERVTRIGRKDSARRLLIEKQRFKMDLSIAIDRMQRAAKSQSAQQRIAFWQTAVVKIARWFMDPRGLQFDPTTYVMANETDTLQLMCDLRSNWLTRKVLGERIIEIVLVDHYTLEIIPKELDLIEATAVMTDGTSTPIVVPQASHVGKVAGASFGILPLIEEVAPNAEVDRLIYRIRDRLESESSTTKPHE